MSSSKNFVIVAPHVDDEVIGCWSYLRDRKVSDVVYLDELTDERRAEAKAAAAMFEFTPTFGSVDIDSIAKEKTLLIPAVTDTHPSHFRANVEYRRFAGQVLFYSVDMNCRTKCVLIDHLDKKASLDRLFPSQKALWESNAAYYLFEDVKDADYHTTRQVAVHLQHEQETVKATSSLFVGQPEKIVDAPNLKALIDQLSCAGPFKIELANGTIYETWN